MRYGGDRRYGLSKYFSGKGMLVGITLGKQGRERKRIGFLDRMKGSRPYCELKREVLEGMEDYHNTTLILHRNLP